MKIIFETLQNHVGFRVTEDGLDFKVEGMFMGVWSPIEQVETRERILKMALKQYSKEYQIALNHISEQENQFKNLQRLIESFRKLTTEERDQAFNLFLAAFDAHNIIRVDFKNRTKIE